MSAPCPWVQLSFLSVVPVTVYFCYRLPCSSAMQVEVLTFLRQVASASGEQLQCGSCTLDASHIEDIDRAVQQAKVRALHSARDAPLP